MDDRLIVDTEKVCIKCKRLLPLEQFYKRPGSPDGYRNTCKACNATYYQDRYFANWKAIRAQRKAYQDSHKEKALEIRRRSAYGITSSQYDDMFTKQGGRCAICGGNNGARRLAIDHDHITGKVRALLCGRCNTAIANAKESIPVLQAMIAYLEAHHG